MRKILKRGDHVEWNSEAGRVRGVILKRLISDYRYKGYVHHASREQPQYLIKSDKIDHVAIHKERALKHIRPRKRKKREKTKETKDNAASIKALSLCVVGKSAQSLPRSVGDSRRL